MIDYTAVLSRRYAGREWSFNGDDYEGLTILDGGSKPAKSELDALWPEVKAEIEAEVAARANAKESAYAKLTALGLTKAEIKALVG